jgi:predicted DNA-binding transcriptional regulator YafY
MPVESGDFGIRELLRLGEDLEVPAPAPLRNQVKQALRRMLRNYQAERSR